MARSIQNAVRPGGVLPQCTRPKLRGSVVAAACQFGSHSQPGETRAVNRHQAQIAAHFHSRHGPRGKIVECQNSYGRIAKKSLGKAHLDGGAEIAYPESPGWIIEAMNGLAAGPGTEPKRIPALRVNSHPAASGSHMSRRKARRQRWLRRHARPTPPVLQTTERWRSPFRSRRISALRGSSGPPEPARTRAIRRVGSKDFESGMPEAPPRGRELPRSR